MKTHKVVRDVFNHGEVCIEELFDSVQHTFWEDLYVRLEILLEDIESLDDMDLPLTEDTLFTNGIKYPVPSNKKLFWLMARAFFRRQGFKVNKYNANGMSIRDEDSTLGTLSLEDDGIEYEIFDKAKSLALFLYIINFLRVADKVLEKALLNGTLKIEQGKLK